MVRRERVRDVRPRPDGPNRNPGFSCADVREQTPAWAFRVISTRGRTTALRTAEQLNVQDPVAGAPERPGAR